MDDNERTWDQSLEIAASIIALARQLPPLIQAWQIQEAYRLNQTMSLHCEECGGWSPPLKGDDLLSACPNAKYVCQGNCDD